MKRGNGLALAMVGLNRGSVPLERMSHVPDPAPESSYRMILASPHSWASVRLSGFLCPSGAARIIACAGTTRRPTPDPRCRPRRCRHRRRRRSRWASRSRRGTDGLRARLSTVSSSRVTEVQQPPDGSLHALRHASMLVLALRGPGGPVMTAKCDDVGPEESEAVAGGMVE